MTNSVQQTPCMQPLVLDMLWPTKHSSVMPIHFTQQIVLATLWPITTNNVVSVHCMQVTVQDMQQHIKHNSVH